MSRKALWASLLIAAAVPVQPARAADHAVAANDNGPNENVFTPADVTIVQGDSVTWSNGGLNQHNVRFDDGSFEQPPSPQLAPWSVSRTFNTPGTFQYYCTAHGMPNGVGMSGKVLVQAPGAAPPAPAPSQSGQPVTADKTAPALKLLGTRRQRVLRQRSVFVLVRVDEPAVVVARATIAVPDAARTVRANSVKKQVAAGKTTRFGLTFSRPRLSVFRRALRMKPRLKAKVTVIARDSAGNKTTAKRQINLRS
jgi:plastocyanin